VINVEDHIYVMHQDMEILGIDHEDVSMRLFTSSLVGYVLYYFHVCVGTLDSTNASNDPKFFGWFLLFLAVF
jgi:hypothetical protein